MNKQYLLALFLLLYLGKTIYAQSGNCDPATPFFTVDMTGVSDSIFIQNNASKIRNLGCCGSPADCIEFEVILDPGAIGLSFMANGPGSGLTYQVDCNLSPYSLGDTVCLNSTGPFTLTFCRNGAVSYDYEIASIPEIISDSIIVDASCFNGSDGSIDIEISGGASPYSYLWNTGAITQDIAALLAGNYFVTVTDANGCVEIASFLVDEPLAISINGTATDASCFAGNDGSISSLTVSGGTPGYNYTWSDINPIAHWTFENSMDDVSGNGNNSTSLVGMEAYSTDATERDSSFDFDGATKIGYSTNAAFMDQAFTEKTIMMWIKPDALVGTQVLYEEGNTNSGMALQLNGASIEAAVREGFVQQNAGSLIFPVAATWHHLALVYDSGNLTLYLDGVAGISTSTGFLSISASGSNGGLGATFTSNTFGSVTDDFYAGLMDDAHYLDIALSQNQISDVVNNNGNRTNLLTGNYLLTLSDANACTQTASFTINEPDEIVISLDSTDISCFGADDGSIDLTVNGGTPTYTYSWSGGAGTGQDPTNLGPGMYTVTVTDNNTCSVVDSIRINEPAALSLSSTTDSVSCIGGNDGAINLTLIGGTSPFSFSWDNGAANVEDPATLSANTYTVTVTDANLCTKTLAVVLATVTPISVVDSLNNTSCFGGVDGSVFLTTSNGTPPYQYNWGNGWVSSSDTTDLSPGTYSVTIADSKNCQLIESYDIAEATEMAITPTISGVTCNGGNDGSVLSVTVSGGSPDYTFEWADIKPEAHWTFEETLDDISGNNHNNNADSEGTFYVSSDAVERDYSMYFDGATRIAYDEPLGGFMDSSFTQRTISMWIKPDAFGGKQTLFEEGGAFYGISFRLQGDRIRAGVTESPSSVVLQSPVLPAAGQWYHVAVVYDNGAFFLYLDGVEVAYSNTGFGEIPSTESAGGIGGNFGYDAIYDGLFGEGDFFYQGRMDDVRYYETALDSMQVVDEMRNDGTRNNLIAQTYTVIVHDANACIKTETITITEPPALTLNIAGIAVSCNNSADGTAKATAGGGVSPYLYSWQSGQSADSISNLAGGKYYLTVTDDNGCTIVDSVTIIEPNPIIPNPQINTNYLGQDVSCFGASDGQASVSATGGNGSYTYLWSPGAVTGNILNNIGAGTYIVTVTDALGCTGVDSVTLANPLQITISITETNNVSCNGDSDGAAQAAVTNGNGPYTYTWENGQTGTDLTGVSAGTYSVTVRDVLGCIAVDSITIAEPTTLSLNVNVNTNYNSYDISCAGASDGGAIANPSGGTGAYSYQWSVLGQTNQTISTLSAGIYTITVTDIEGCTVSGSVTLTDPPGLSTTFNLSDPSDCGLNDGTITVNPSGGIGNYEYRLSTGSWQSSNSFTGLAPGVYNIYIRTNPGTCEIGPFAQVLSLPESPSFDNITLINPSTGISTDGAILITASGSGVQINYQLLDNGGAVLVPWQEGSLFSGLTEDTYTLELRYYNQTCISSLDVTLVGGGGIVGSVTGVDFCSGELNSGQFVETYYIPGPEDQILDALQSIVPTSCGLFEGIYPIDPVSNFISIGIIESGTILYYDHYEIDGYESNLSIPTQASTEIWGIIMPLTEYRQVMLQIYW